MWRRPALARVSHRYGYTYAFSLDAGIGDHEGRAWLYLSFGRARLHVCKSSLSLARKLAGARNASRAPLHPRSLTSHPKNMLMQRYAHESQKPISIESLCSTAVLMFCQDDNIALYLESRR